MSHLICGQCGYDLAGLDASMACPECGATAPRAPGRSLGRAEATLYLGGFLFGAASSLAWLGLQMVPRGSRAGAVPGLAALPLSPGINEALFVGAICCLSIAGSWLTMSPQARSRPQSANLAAIAAFMVTLLGLILLGASLSTVW